MGLKFVPYYRKSVPIEHGIAVSPPYNRKSGSFGYAEALIGSYLCKYGS